jgi:hypothetical protein
MTMTMTMTMTASASARASISANGGGTGNNSTSSFLLVQQQYQQQRACHSHHEPHLHCRDQFFEEWGIRSLALFYSRKAYIKISFRCLVESFVPHPTNQ